MPDPSKPLRTLVILAALVAALPAAAQSDAEPSPEEPAGAAPCASEEYRQFDFWLGTWDVVSPDGKPLGKNTVERILDGCLLTESWESATGSQGFSINYYDRDTGTWTQTYRDNRGDVSAWPDLTGGLRDGAMVLESRADPESWSRWIWTSMPDGRVRQMAETSSDQGATWTVIWDSYYVRAE
jgi:hypothetical protein